MTTLALNVAPPTLPPAATSTATANAEGYSDFSFHDLVSIFNPLQHIPVVSTLYRAITGDTIQPFERIAGDTLYGGWMGLASSVANLVFEKETGKDFGASVLAFVETGDLPTFAAASTTQTAAAVPGAMATSAPSSATDKDYGIAALAAVEAGRRPKPDTPPREADGVPTRLEGQVVQASASPRSSATSDDTGVAAVAFATNDVPTKPGAAATLAAAPLPSEEASEDPGAASLETSLRGAHADPDLYRRALYAYRKAIGATAPPPDLPPAN